jgi:hypothetical protein
MCHRNVTGTGSGTWLVEALGEEDPYTSGYRGTWSLEFRPRGRRLSAWPVPTAGSRLANVRPYSGRRHSAASDSATSAVGQPMAGDRYRQAKGGSWRFDGKVIERRF